ncbi:hypothetical protein [Flavobacterium sp. LB2P44]|uniref:hypothetical protein n=1 Tax=Flavobacterium sp. LB2P44 TaxID=3401713 RepID=UPI003AAD6C3F
MKKLMPLLGILSIAITVTSCKSENEKKAEIATNNYIRFIDSVANISSIDALTKWNTIEKYFEKKSDQLNTKIDRLEDTTVFDSEINPATAKYEALRNSILQRKTKLETANLTNP